MLVFVQAGLIWKPHGKAKIKRIPRLYATHMGKDSLLCPEIADLSNEDHNTCSKNMFSQPHKSQERILLKRPFADSGIGTPTLRPTKLRVIVGSKVDYPGTKYFLRNCC